MILGIVNINSCVTSKRPVIKKKWPCDTIIELVTGTFLLHTVNKHQCSFFNNLFTITGNNDTMYSKNRIGNINFIPKYLYCFSN